MRLSFVLLFVVSLLAFAQRNTSESNFVQIAAVWQPEAVASDADWTKAIEKGHRLTCRLEATDEGAGRLWYDTRNPPSAQALWSDYTLKQDLELWGWHESEWNDAANCNFADDDDDDDHENKIGTSSNDSYHSILSSLIFRSRSRYAWVLTTLGHGVAISRTESQASFARRRQHLFQYPALR
jgi:hypothetical protein